MAISQPYQETLKKRAVARFVKKHDRTPTDSELRDLTLREFRNYPSVDQVGVSGFDITKPQFQSVSSAEDENVNRKALFDDMCTIAERVDRLTLLLEESYRGFKGTVRRIKHTLSQLESRLDNLLLLNGNVDQFVYGIEETFDLQDMIDFDNTTASVEAGYVTLGRGGYSVLELTDSRISTLTTSEKGFLGSQNTSKVEFLKEEDGTLWEHLVYTKQRTGRVSVLIDVDLEESAYVGDMRFSGAPVGVNQHTTATIFYSLDGQTYTALEPAEIAVTEDEHQFNIGLDGVQKVRIMLSKEVADNVTTTANQHVYIFNLDSLKIYTDAYTDGAESELITNAYEIVDELGDPVFFTKATCEACTITDEDSSVSFFLSKDKVVWHPVDPTGESLNFVSFADGSKEGSFDTIDPDKAQGELVDDVPDLDDLDLTHEAALNIFVPEDFVPDISLRNVIVKRNIVDSDMAAETQVYGVPQGWYFDDATNQYTTTIFIEADEGRFIDLGPTGAFINGTLLAGEVHLQKGHTVLATSDSNWREIEDDITTLGALKRADSLYPYNHRYIVEGYNYPASFTGERVYTGVDEYFGRLLTFVPPEQFNSDDSDTDLGIFTVDDPSGDMFFKVKVDRTDATWLNELYDIDWLVHADTSNLIYVRAILSAVDNANSPVIENFKVRVI